MVLESEEWKEDPELQKLPTLDVLLAFEDYSRVREREFEEQMRRRQVEKTRKERKAREAFRVCPTVQFNAFSQTNQPCLGFAERSCRVRRDQGAHQVEGRISQLLHG